MAEKRVLGMDHGEIGAMLLERWKFPLEIKNPIAAHYQEKIPEETNAYDVSLLRVADILSHGLSPKNEEANSLLPVINEKDFMLLKTDEQDLEDMKGYLKEEKEEIDAFFNAIM